MSILCRPDGDDIAKMYGKYMTSSDFAMLIANQEVKVLCQNGLLTAVVLGFDFNSGIGRLVISKTSEEYCGSFDGLYIAQPRKLFKKSLSCPERAAVVTAEKKPRIETEPFSPLLSSSFSMHAVTPDVAMHSNIVSNPQCPICNADLAALADLEREVHISCCLDCSVCVDVSANGNQETLAENMEDQILWAEYDKKSINDDDNCLICNDNLASLTEVERNQHMLRCCLALQELENEAQQDNDQKVVDEEKYLFLTQPQPEFNCNPVPSSSSTCGVTYSSVSYSSSSRDVGVPVVSNTVSTSNTSYSASANPYHRPSPYMLPPPFPVSASTAPSLAPVPAPSVIKEDRGFMCRVFYCVICDLDLSKKQLSNRFQHMKQCAKAHHIDTKVLMAMIAPEEAAAAVMVDETEEQEEQHRTKENWQFMMNNGKTAPPSSGSLSAAKMVAVQVEDEEGMVPIGAGLDKKGRRKSGAKKDVGSAGESGTKSASSSSSKSASGSGTSSSSGKKGYWGSWKKTADKPNTGYAPAYKKVLIGGMTSPIVVDGFQYACPQLSTCYFLTHFHSDHYMGLEKDFNAGTIYCSPTTAALVQMKLRVGAEHLVSLDLEKRYVIEVGGVKVEVTLLEANHCPGAVCILFAFSNGKLVLHTGDFRWNSKTLLPLSPTYRALAATAASTNPRNLLVYLDTTYCEAGHNFPPQSSVIDQIVDTVRDEARQAGTLFVFGAYTIGKERVFMAAAEELRMKVHVDTTRYRTMMTYDWSQKEKDKLTTDPSTTWVWVTDMGKINFNQLDSLKQRRPGCKRIVAFSPTGWTHTGGGGGGWSAARGAKKDNSAAAVAAGSVASDKSSLHARHKDGNTIYSVSYSEHSSFPELVDFIRTFQPQRVIPTVNCSAEKVKEQVELLRVASGMSNASIGGAVGGVATGAAVVQRHVDMRRSEFK